MTYYEILERIKNYTDPYSEANKDIKKFLVIVSSDSQRHGRITKFSTAITIRRLYNDSCGNGGIYFYRNDYINNINHNAIKQKILMETTMVVSTAYMLDHDLENWALWLLDHSKDVEIELHVDVSETGGSKVALKDVKSMVMGTGYRCKIKPDCYAAMGVSNKHTK